MARCMSRTSADLRALLDEISNLEEIGERAKKDIMEDDDTRNVSWLVDSLHQAPSDESTVDPIDTQY